MNKLNAKQIKELTELESTYQDAASDVNDAIEKFNTELTSLRDGVETSLNAYNEALSALRDFRDDIVNSMDEYISDRSEKWQEGDRGQAYEGWKSEWESAELEDAEIELPADLEEFDYVEQPLSDLPQELEV